MANELQDQDFSAVPSYLLAADTHNIANNNDSWFDAATLGTGAVVGAGATQLYNILPTIGNWLGGDFEQAKTKDVLQDFDSDLGNYYSRHQEGVDALGFALSSIVPGMAGVKVLKAGQVMLRGAMETGTLGTNLQAATGLLPSSTKPLAAAIEAALKPNAGFPIFNSETVKAIGFGFGQAALEGAAWETAVAATMYNSPILEKQDLGDITSNILWGAATFGAIGGTLNLAKTYSTIKGASKELALEMGGVTRIAELPANASASDRILNYLSDHAATSAAVPDSSEWLGENAWKLGKYESLKADKLRTLDDRIRGLTGELAGGDQDLAAHLYNAVKKLPYEQVEAKLFATEGMSRLGTKSAAEQEFNRVEKRVLENQLFGATEADQSYYLTRTKTYVKLTGEDAGKVLDEKPTLWNLGDSIKPGETLEITKRGVTAGSKVFKFDVEKPFDIFTASHQQAEARQVWATKGVDWSEQRAKNLPVIVGENDIALLDKAYQEGVLPRVKLESKAAGSIEFQTKEEYLNWLQGKKQQVYQQLTGPKSGLESAEAAKIANISEDLVGGVQRGSREDNLFAYQKAARDYQNSFTGAGLKPPGDYWNQPTWAVSMKDTTAVKDIDGNVLTGLVAIKQEQKLYEQAAKRATAPIFGEDTDKFFTLSDSMVGKANPIGPGGGMLSAQNENFGSLGSMTQYLGAQTLKLIGKLQEGTHGKFDPLLYKLAQKPDAAIEWSVLNSKLRQFGATPFGYDAEQQAMRPLSLIKYERDLAAGLDVKLPNIAEEVPLSIPVRNAEVADLVSAHIETNGSRTTQLGAIRSNQGVKFSRDPERFYPIPPNTKDYPYIASVIDDSISGAGHGKMLYAATAKDLEEQITAVRAADSTLKVLTKSDAENWYKSVGQYEFERTLTDISFDASKIARGTSAQYLPATDPQKIVADTLNWHLARDGGLAREAVSHINESQFATLRTMGEKFANITDSHFTKLDPIAYLEMQGKNPYADYVRSALGLKTSKDFPFWTPINDMLDRKVSGIFNRVYETFANATSPAQLDAINKSLADSGYQGAAYTAMTQGFANHTAPKGALTAFVGKANAILSSCMLGLDPINALTNFIGSNVLRTTELQSLIRNINASNTSAAGELAGLSRLKVPGTQDSVFSPAKMLAKALGDLHSESGAALREEFTAHGLNMSRVDQANWVLGKLSLTGKESVQELESIPGQIMSGLRTVAAKGEVLTGNVLAESANRFLSAHVAKQIVDKGVEAGLIGEREAWAYINTFVNRVEGNYIAAQRPGVFQGPIGQAIGLFQTYQFNLIQQLLRHVGEGGAKDAAMMMGMQSTLFGLKGLPAFDAINTHIIGNASGNTNHRDLYDATFGAAGKEAGDWLMYGVGSNALGLISPDLKLNLYSRGDINPRNVTLLPTNPANIPFVQAAGKFFSNLKETSTKIAQGGDVWNSFLQGIEHAGISRPLSGMAQTLEALGNSGGRSYSTSNRGDIVASNDFLSLANMIRVAGAKPLDEAIGVDRAFNLEVYAAKDSSLRKELGESLKTTLIANQLPNDEQVNTFAAEYAKFGGKQEHFNQFMMQQFKSANASQVNKLALDLKKPFAQSMQTILGGQQFKDFTNSPI